MATESNSSTAEYLSQLLQDQCNLRVLAPGKFKYLQEILEREIANVASKITQEHENGEPDNKNDYQMVTLSQIIMVPVDKYPTYNFVGRILGPRGMTVRQLEEQTGCKIMVRGRGSIKGKIRDRGSEDEPLHILIQCEDSANRVKDKMQRAIDRVSDLLTPPPDGKDELKRKQLVELAIINGTYRPTNATKTTLQSPSSLDGGHLSTGIDNTILGRFGNSNPLPDSDLLQKLHQLQLFACTGNNTLTDYLLKCSVLNPMVASSFLSSGSNDYINSHSNNNGVHQATLQEYLDASALLNSIPSFVHDGSGDCPKKQLSQLNH